MTSMNQSGWNILEYSGVDEVAQKRAGISWDELGRAGTRTGFESEVKRKSLARTPSDLENLRAKTQSCVPVRIVQR